VTDGGTLVALNDASRFAVERLLLPVRNGLESVADDEFLRSRIDLSGSSSTRATRSPAACPPSLWRGTKAVPRSRCSIRAPRASWGAIRLMGNKVLLSGWALHPERVAGRGALVEVKLGTGRVVCFGFRPQYREVSRKL